MMIGLFAGIGGIELGLESAGYETAGLCELDDAAHAVLKQRFGLPTHRIWRDIADLDRLPPAEIVTAGFPCQDLSQAGRKAGIKGTESSLVSHVFRLLDQASVDTVVLENVSYMLRLDKGAAMAFLVSQLEERGYDWAYRVVDARSFGIPQRRQRVLLVASRVIDPSTVLHADAAETGEFDDAIGIVDPDAAYGFYWTEGLRGLGWTKNAVPTIKGGSRLGIPSPPAIWFPKTGLVGTPSIEDAEALQGFQPGWTESASVFGRREGARWRLVGNAVCVPMSTWLGDRLRNPGIPAPRGKTLSGLRWPVAAAGSPSGFRHAVDVSVRVADTPFAIEPFLKSAVKPLSERATRGFLSRARRGKLRFSDGFLEALEAHLIQVSEGQFIAA